MRSPPTRLARSLESGVRLPPASRWGWDEQDSNGGETRCEEIRTAVLQAGPPVWVVLSLVTPTGSPVAEVVLRRSGPPVSTSPAWLRDYRRAARNLARVLLEPGETAFPHLRQHSQARRSWRSAWWPPSTSPKTRRS